MTVGLRGSGFISLASPVVPRQGEGVPMCGEPQGMPGIRVPGKEGEGGEE